MGEDIIRRFAQIQWTVAGGHKTGELDFEGFLTIYAFIKEQAPKEKANKLDTTLNKLEDTRHDPTPSRWKKREGAVSPRPGTSPPPAGGSSIKRDN